MREAALAGIEVARRAGPDHRVRRPARRLRAGDGRRPEREHLVEVLLGGVGALIVLVFVFGSLHGPRAAADGRDRDPDDVPGPLAAGRGHRGLDRRAVPGRPDRARDRDRLRAADRDALARGAPGGATTRPRSTKRWSTPAGPWSSAARGRDRPARAGRAADPVPAQHGLRRHADPAGQRAVGITLLPVILATIGPRLDRPRARRRRSRAGAGWMAWARLVVRRRWAAAIAPPRCWPRSSPPPSRPAGNPRADSLAQRAGAGGARAARATRAWAPGRCRPSRPSCAAGDPARSPRALADVDGVRAAVAPRRLAPGRHGARQRHPAADGNSGRGPRDARAGARRAPAGESWSAARPRRAPTSSTPSTATSRSSSR